MIKENLNKLEQIITNEAINSFDKVLIAGDFNFPGIDWFNNTYSGTDNEKFIEMVHDGFLIQHVIKPTRFRLGQESIS